VVKEFLPVIISTVVKSRCKYAAVPRLLALVCVCAVAVGGCYWLRYQEMLSTHMEVMVSFANDGCDLLSLARSAPDRGLSNADIARMRYPYTRASDLARVAHRRWPQRLSLQRFETLVETYGRLIEDLDRARVNGARGTRKACRLAAEVEAIALEVTGLLAADS
jgi:hypothetical protein